MALTPITDTRELTRVSAFMTDKLLGGVMERAYDEPGTLSWFQRNAKRTWAGGDQISKTVQLEKSPAGGSLGAFGTMDFTVPNAETRALVTPQVYAVGCVLSIPELQRTAANDLASASYYKHRVDDCGKKLRDLVNGSRGIHGDGTTAATDFVGLKGLFASDQTTGTWMGVSRANTNWRAKVTDNAQTTANILANLRTVATNVEDGSDMGEVWFTNRAGRDIYETKLTATLETDPLVIGSRGRGAVADGGVGHIAYRGKAMIVDVNLGLVASGSSSQWYCLNPKGGEYMALYAHPQADFSWSGPVQESEDQLLLKRKLVFHGALVCWNPNRQGTVEDGAAS